MTSSTSPDYNLMLDPPVGVDMGFTGLAWESTVVFENQTPLEGCTLIVPEVDEELPPGERLTAWLWTKQMTDFPPGTRVSVRFHTVQELEEPEFEAKSAADYLAMVLTGEIAVNWNADHPSGM